MTSTKNSGIGGEILLTHYYMHSQQSAQTGPFYYGPIASSSQLQIADDPHLQAFGNFELQFYSWEGSIGRQSTCSDKAVTDKRKMRRFLGIHFSWDDVIIWCGGNSSNGTWLSVVIGGTKHC